MDLSNIDALHATLNNVLQNQFGLKAFRPGQIEAITTLLTQQRLLCIQPTGHGKSLLYQLPSILLPGLTVVISPLLALMRDQIQQLNERFGIQAVSINSDQNEMENFNAQRLVHQGHAKIIFIAPEKLDRLDYSEFLLNLPLSLLVIDEAHCISTWGHDFRPSYRQILHFVKAAEAKYNTLRVLAITATANNKTEQDISEQLTTNHQVVQIHRQSMARPNLHLSVIKAFGMAEKLAYCEALMRKLDGAGLIYCATRENTELVAEYLTRQGMVAAAYHAGFAAEDKRVLQQQFIANQYQVMVATNALGMGIDKQDLRFIIHFDMPGSITAYYQEVGRCGRDGEDAYGILLFDEADKKIQRYFIDSAQPKLDDFSKVLSCIRQARVAPNLATIKRETGLHPTRVTVVIAELMEQGFIRKSLEHRRQVYHRVEKTEKLDLQRYDNQLQMRNRELAEMLDYGQQAKRCYMATLRQALGDHKCEACGHCGVCKKESHEINCDNKKLLAIKAWLDNRVASINLGKAKSIEEGTSVLDGKVRSPLFIEFMKTRMIEGMPINQKLLSLVEEQLTRLCAKHRFKSIVVLPSRTWQGRDVMAKAIAGILKVPCYLDYLHWHTTPEARQGELLNNDQRKYNVENKLWHNHLIKIPNGPILLLDDYIGSGATLKEAARAIKHASKNEMHIVPFTIAQIRWRLGKPGFL